MSIEEEVLRYQRQFLVHSFLYYKIDETIWDDTTYDQCCKKMIALMGEDHVRTKYHELCLPCGDTGSGYYIRKYPPEIESTALHILYNIKKENPKYKETFSHFLSRYGCGILR